jgi:hypothetical protein
MTQAIGVVAQPIDGGRSEQPVAREGLVPLGEVEVAGDDGGGLLVALGDQSCRSSSAGARRGFRPKSSMISTGTRASCWSFRS